MPINEELSKAITDYYKLKQQYEDKINRQKNIIIKNDTLTLAQKRKKIKKLMPICIICKNKGVTIFASNNGVLTAICGSNTPCKLNIKLNRGNFVNVRVLDTNLAEDLEKAKIEIIKTKLDVLFNYTSEAEAIQKFNILRPELKSIEDLKFKWQKHYLNVVDNRINKDKLNYTQTKFYIEKQELKNLGKQYDETQKPAILRDMVEKYNSNIKPLAEEIMNLKYSYVGLECLNGTQTPCKENDPVFLIEKNYTLNDLEADIGEQTGIINNDK